MNSIGVKRLVNTTFVVVATVFAVLLFQRFMKAHNAVPKPSPMGDAQSNTPAKPAAAHASTPKAAPTPIERKRPEPPPPPIKDPDPILPTSVSKDYELVLEECSRSAEKVDCWGYMTSKNDAPAEAFFQYVNATDDEGHAFRGSIGLENQQLASGVKTRWHANFPEAHANAHSLTLQIHIHFGVHGEFADNDQIVFKDIPFDKKNAPTE